MKKQEHTEQQKAEAYVRSQLPELMELSFGCVVRFKYDTHLQNYEGVKNIVVGATEHKIAGIAKGFYVLTSNKNTGAYTPDQLEIIGHPIQLQHWLRVLTEKFGDPILEWQPNRLRLTYFEIDIWFNLTTGQPSNEADYKAFNDIVGV